MGFIRNKIVEIVNKCERTHLLKKFGDYNVPIKYKNNWYYKEYGNFDGKNKFQIKKYSPLSMYHFESYAKSGLHFHYEYGKYVDVPESIQNSYKQNLHSHDFWQVLEDVYNYPQTFMIPSDSVDEYSKQELEWINNLQKSCLKDGLKDIGYYSYKDKKMEINYNILELKKRRINKVRGVNIKKYLRDINFEKYLSFDENGKVYISEI